MPPLYNFNPGQKSWKMYANTLTSIAGDDLTISPVEDQDLVLEVSGNHCDIILKHANNNVFRIDSATATISPHTTVENYLNVSGGAQIGGQATLVGGFNVHNDGLIVKSYLGATGMDLSSGELIIHSTNNHNLIVDTAIDMSKNGIIDLSSVAFSNTANITTPDVGTLTVSGDIDVLGNVDISGKLLLFNTELSGNITTSSSHHNATIKTTGNSISSNKFLNIKINGMDAWIPYFTTDPSQ